MFRRKNKEIEVVESDDEKISDEMIFEGLKRDYVELDIHKNTNAALQIAQQIKSKFPDDSLGWLYIANVYLVMENYQLAIENYEKGIEIYENNSPYDPEMHINLAFAYYFIDDYDKTLEILDKALNTNPNLLDAIGLQGLVYLKKKNLDKAYKLLKEVKDKLATRFHFWEGLINIYLEKDEIDLAFETAKEYIDLFPRQEDMWFLLGNLEFQSKNYKEALKAYKKAHSININNLKILRKYIDCQMKLEMFTDVVYYGYQLIQKKPDDIPAFITIIKAYKKIGDINSAQEYLSQALSFDADNSDLHNLKKEIGKLTKSKKKKKPKKEEIKTKEDDFYDESKDTDLEIKENHSVVIGSSYNQKKETKQILEYFANVAVCTNEKLDLDEKIDYLINFDVLPLYIPVLLELKQKEIRQMVDKYKRRLSQKSFESLQKLPVRYSGKSTKKITKKQKDKSNKLAQEGWNQLHSINELLGPKQKEVLRSTAEVFIDALILNPEHVAALIGIGLCLNLASENIHEAFEWLAKAYSLNSDLTVKILVEQRYYPQLEKLLEFVENFI